MAAGWGRIRSAAPREVRPDSPSGAATTPDPEGLEPATRGRRAASPARKLEGEEQRAAERHSPAEKLGPPARHEGGAAQSAAEPARRGRSGRGRAVGASGAAAAATLVLGVVAAAAAAAAAAASAFQIGRAHV